MKDKEKGLRKKLLLRTQKEIEFFGSSDMRKKMDAEFITAEFTAELFTSTWKIGEKTFILGPFDYLIMGIINVTPDSFYPASRTQSIDSAVQKALQMVQEGAHIIDVGGESTRPGSSPVNTEEEIKRVVPVIVELRKMWDGPISVDTYKAPVAEKALSAGADIVNDISGLTFDRDMKDVVVRRNASVVIMHTSGPPSCMQEKTRYENMLEVIYSHLENAISCLESCGMDGERIAIDPGIGFGKTAPQNLFLMKHLEYFHSFGRPILVGPSRKSFIAHTYQNVPPENRLPGTIAASIMCFLSGAKIFRLHDVKEGKQALQVAASILKAEPEVNFSHTTGEKVAYRS